MRAPVQLLSVAASTDAAWLAVRDVAHLADGLGIEYRLIGGNAVELLVHRHGVSELVPARESADADLGVPFEVCVDPRFVPAIAELGYQLFEGNRFVRLDGERRLIIDVLVPSYVSKMQTNQPAGDLVVDAIPGLLMALSLPSTDIDLRVHLTDGTDVEATVALADVRGALALKASAYRDRHAQRDAIDVWRLLEAAFAAGHRARDWPGTGSGRDASRLLWRYFGPTGTAIRDARTRARVRALLSQIVPRPETTG